MRILITGGTGLIGQALIPRLLAAGHTVSLWLRKPNKAQVRYGDRATWVTKLEQLDPAMPIDGVINLAGQPIFDRAWSAERKATLRSSRIELTSQLIATLAQHPSPPHLLLSGSAIGYYHCSEQEVDESGLPGSDFAAQLCQDWEQAAAAAHQAWQARVILLRTGLVLSRMGGMLPRMALPVRLRIGLKMGTGRQVMSWIHVHDYIDAILYLLQQPLAAGPYNLTSPHPVSHERFMDNLAATLGRSCRLRLSAPILRRWLGARASLILEGCPAIPRRLLEAGFHFHFPELEPALENILLR